MRWGTGAGGSEPRGHAAGWRTLAHPSAALADACPRAPTPADHCTGTTPAVTAPSRPPPSAASAVCPSRTTTTARCASRSPGCPSSESATCELGPRLARGRGPVGQSGRWCVGQRAMRLNPGACLIQQLQAAQAECLWAWAAPPPANLTRSLPRHNFPAPPDHNRLPVRRARAAVAVPPEQACRGDSNEHPRHSGRRRLLLGIAGSGVGQQARVYAGVWVGGAPPFFWRGWGWCGPASACARRWGGGGDNNGDRPHAARAPGRSIPLQPACSAIPATQHTPPPTTPLAAPQADQSTVTIHDYSIRVDGLPRDADGEELVAFFSQYGEV